MGIKNSTDSSFNFDIILNKVGQRNLFLEQLLNKLPNAIGIFDKDGKYVTSNDKFIELFKGIPPKEYSIFEDPHFKHKSIINAFKSALREDINYEFPKVWYNLKNISPEYPDHEICLKTTAIPLKNENGELNYIFLIYYDKTELEKERMTLKNIIELNPYAIDIKDKNGFQIMHNQAFIDMWGVPNPEDYSIFNDPQLKKSGQIEFFREMYDGKVFEVPECYFNPHDSRKTLPDKPVWQKAVGFPIFDRKGEVEQIVIMYEDKKKKKTAELKLEELKEQLENRVRERTILLENSEKKYRKAYNRTKCFKGLFTHDVSNIFQVVSNSIEYIEEKIKDKLNENGKTLLTATKKNLARGKKLIHNIRNLSEIEESEMPIIPTRISFHLHKAIEFLKDNFLDRKINIIIPEIDEEIYVLANELLLDVFENILINAVRYNNNTDIIIEIKISEIIEDDNKFIKIEFIDNGIGIKDERKEQIFMENYDKSSRSKGMGLGLSLVSKIIKLCHGKLWVENRIPHDYTKGSNFIVQIPKANKKTDN